MPVVTTNQTFEEFLTNAGFPTYPCDCRRPAPDMIYDKAWPHRQCKGCRGFLGPARVMAIDTTDKPSRDTPNKAWPFAGMDVGVRAWWDERYIDAGNDAVIQKARNVWAKALLDAADFGPTDLKGCRRYYDPADREVWIQGGRAGKSTSLLLELYEREEERRRKYGPPWDFSKWCDDEGDCDCGTPGGVCTCEADAEYDINRTGDDC